eukprot:TRINITY_DN9762_c0_g1_i1.p1 TRINITY_DN9762_c0_g1~~TRINITY_DN9762_c0_g1_i1.p1  ORF type:complete len:517 (-),score=62.55 TRINITY_DN9762_c0_g1_i1:84-1634(-)
MRFILIAASCFLISLTLSLGVLFLTPNHSHPTHAIIKIDNLKKIEHSPQTNRPNIIFILADDLGIAEIEPFNTESVDEDRKIFTPNLVKFAQESMKFTNSYAGSPICAPSRCTLLTGLHTGHCSVRHNNNFEFKGPTFAQLLRKHGYDTALMGKWGMLIDPQDQLGSPLSHGFSTFLGFMNHTQCHSYYPREIYSDRSVLSVDQPISVSREVCMKEESGCHYSEELFLKGTEDYIREKAGVTPFMVMVSMVVPHTGRWTEDGEYGSPVPNQGRYRQKEWPEVEKDHAAMITYHVDAAVGRIMNVLKEKNIDENTVIFFASDNGAHNEGGHDYQFFRSSGLYKGLKRSLYEGGLKSPTMVRWKGHIPMDTTSPVPWGLWDVFPTLTDLAQIPSNQIPQNLDGISLVPTLLGENQNLRERVLYWETCTQSDRYRNPLAKDYNYSHTHHVARAVRWGKWKGISWIKGQGFTELYDLESDPYEMHNVASKHRNVIGKISEIAKGSHSVYRHWIGVCKRFK